MNGKVNLKIFGDGRLEGRNRGTNSKGYFFQIKFEICICNQYVEKNKNLKKQCEENIKYRYDVSKNNIFFSFSILHFAVFCYQV